MRTLIISEVSVPVCMPRMNSPWHVMSINWETIFLDYQSSEM